MSANTDNLLIDIGSESSYEVAFVCLKSNLVVFMSVVGLSCFYMLQIPSSLQVVYHLWYDNLKGRLLRVIDMGIGG